MFNFIRMHSTALVCTASITVLGLYNALVAPLPVFELITLILAGALAIRRLVDRDPAQPVAPAGGLQSALDFAHDAIMILGADGRINYANLEFGKLARLSPGRMAQKPAFADIITEGCANGLFRLERLDKRFEWKDEVAALKAGHAAPLTLRLANEATVRLSISPLPDGGWMVICSNITDLAHDAERLEELAHIDSMTGLVNRRRFFDLAQREWTMATRFGRCLSVLMIDLDHFKAVNDTFGHDVGDRAICHVADICKESKRSTDQVARLGGEEFAILLPETDLAGASVLAERIRLRVQAKPLPVDGGFIPLTISIGVAERVGDMADFDALLKLSDERLYVAKRTGRNRIACLEAGNVLPASDAPRAA